MAMSDGREYDTEPMECPVCGERPPVGRLRLMIGGHAWQVACHHGHLEGGMYRDRAAAVHSWNAVVCDVLGYDDGEAPDGYGL